YERCGRLFTLGAHQIGEHGAHALKHGEICAAAEGVLARCDDDPFDGFIGSDLVDECTQLFDHTGGDDVHRAIGHVPGNEGDSVSVDIEPEIRHRSLPQYGSPFFLV